MSTKKIEVLRPTGMVLENKAEAAVRDVSLDGKRIGLVWNHKDYGDKLLDAVEEIFKERYPKAILSRFQLKECCKKPPEGEIESIAKEVDAVVYTLGD
ncbi:MAG: hypothetical protein H8D23_14165 [Candidatus Brocadiales bacterium]|nr:hypothetical protein [Candidatus Brocadiales bacterium]